jgi:hypothetical protein
VQELHITTNVYKVGSIPTVHLMSIKQEVISKRQIRYTVPTEIVATLVKDYLKGHGFQIADGEFTCNNIYRQAGSENIYMQNFTSVED